MIEEASPITVIMPSQVVPQKRLASQTTSTDPVVHVSKSSRVGKGKEKSSSFRRSKDDYFTLHLPKSVLEMPIGESSDMVSAMATRDDIFQTRELSVEAVEELMDKRLTQVNDFYMCFSFCHFSFSFFLFYYLFQFLALNSIRKEKAKAISSEQLQEDLKKKDEELLSAAGELSKLTGRLSDLEKENSDLKSSLSKLKEDIVVRESAALEKGISEGFSQGLRACCQRLFLTRAGQGFLKSLHQGLLEAYRRSALYVREMGLHIGHFAKIGFVTAQKQAISQGFKGSFDKQAMVQAMTPSPHWKGDVNEAADHPFWLPMMREAIQDLVANEDFSPLSPDSSEIVYNVSPAPLVPSSSGVSSPLPSFVDTPAPTLEDPTADPSTTSVDIQ